jgi:carbamoyltransferase
MYLGINAYSHDSSACLIDSKGKIIAAVEEERFTGKKHDSSFPVNSIKYCLSVAKISSLDLKGVGYAWHPKEMLFKRIIKEYLFEYHVTWSVFKSSLRKLWCSFFIKKDFEKYIGKLNSSVVLRYYNHHTAHVASAFYASGFDEATFFTLDGRGEYQTGVWGNINYEKEIDLMGSIHHPNSLGNIWSAVSEYCGFRPGWHKAGTTMAFASLGKPIYMDRFEKIINFHPERKSDWLKIDTKYFDNRDGIGHIKPEFEALFGEKSCEHGKDKQIHRDVAATLQSFTEKVIVEKLNEVYLQTKIPKLVMAGGVCLNSVANALVLEKTPFKEMFIQPASHDAGLCIGSAYLLQQEFNKQNKPESMVNAYFGPEFSDEDIESELVKENSRIDFLKVNDISLKVANLIHEGSIVAWFQGRMEYGPRALGSRSILASASKKEMIDKLNKVKHRESFRPFAISILEDRKNEWLVKGYKSPFMLIVEAIKPNLKHIVPAAQHIDGSVRTQTVNEMDNGEYYNLLKEYYDISKIPLFINTSFNIKGKPIVLSPKDGIEAFLDSDIDYLAIGPYLVNKKNMII